MKLPPGYDGACRRLSRRRRAREARREAALRRAPHGAEGGRHVVHGRPARRGHVRERSDRRPGAAQDRRVPHLPPRQRGRRPRDGGDAGDPRRGVDHLDAQARAALRRVRLDGAAAGCTCRSCATPTSSKISKRKNPTSLIWYRDAGLPARGAAQLPRADGLQPQHGAARSSRSTRCSPTSTRSGSRRPGPVFDLEKLKWLNGEWIRRLPADDARRAPRRAPAAPAAARAGRRRRATPCSRGSTPTAARRAATRRRPRSPRSSTGRCRSCGSASARSRSTRRSRRCSSATTSPPTRRTTSSRRSARPPRPRTRSARRTRRCPAAPAFDRRRARGVAARARRRDGLEAGRLLLPAARGGHRHEGEPSALRDDGDRGEARGARRGSTPRRGCSGGRRPSMRHGGADARAQGEAPGCNGRGPACVCGVEPRGAGDGARPRAGAPGRVLPSARRSASHVTPPADRGPSSGRPRPAPMDGVLP